MSLRFAQGLSWLGTAAVVTVLAGADLGAYGQDLEPRNYANMAVRLNFLIAGYGYSQGSVVTDPSLPLKDAKVQAHGTVLADVRSLNAWGKSGKVTCCCPPSGHRER